MVAYPAREPLQRYLRTQALTDADIRRIMKDASREAERLVAGFGDGIGAQVRKAQLAVAEVTRDAWRYAGDAAFVGIGDGADAAGESLAFLNNIMFDAAGLSQAYWREAMLAQARAGIESIRSRRINNISLSERVYKNGTVASGQIGRIIDAGLANGFSAKEIARAVKGYISPDVPGGMSYAAMRLGRTEVNNAFHTTTTRMYQDQPWVNGMRWSLSSSHGHADDCDNYANDVHFRGGDPGVFKPTEVPSKPHPQCFCYIMPVTPSDDDFVRAFQQGKYDNYINGTAGCSRG